ncbi:MAG: Na+/H+ antiporter NhaA [Deltaproteobacteria bacterium]|nr:Na+/H+ antiporter NhaA [Deltaproteobacteria bacterium]
MPEIKRPLPPLFQVVLRPFQSFFELEMAGGILLVVAAAVALAWANSPWAAVYEGLLHYPLAVQVGSLRAAFELHVLVNDVLMTVFFAVVGMEIKRELAVGELRTPARALLPAVAAVGGMAVPGLVYLAFNAGRPSASGWAIPMATDIAFSIGVLTLVRGRVHHGLVVFLTALAIFDDLGGILVIALFYGSGLHAPWLLAALGVTAVLALFNHYYVRNGVLWLAGGAALWTCMHHGGIHATIAGVVLGMCMPARGLQSPGDVLEALRRHVEGLSGKPAEEEVQAQEILQIEETLEDLEPPLNRFVHLLHPWVVYGILPLFALANAGVALRGGPEVSLLSPVSLGVGLGLLLGKPVGIFLTTWMAVRAGLSPMPGKAHPAQLFGVAVVGGIGFTVALFVASLSFPGMPGVLDSAKLGVLVGSFASALLGYAILRFGPGAREAA